MAVVQENLPFRLSSDRQGHSHGLARHLRLAGQSFLESVLGFPALNEIYARTLQVHEGDFSQRALACLPIETVVSADDVRRIPGTGPLIAIANHPFGGLDGLILLNILRRVRPDVKLLVNYLLGRIPELRDAAFFVDPFGGPDAEQKNRAALKAALRWVEGGGALGVFPAGEVSHFSWRDRTICDPAWNPSIARVAHRSRAAVIPFFFAGCNGLGFQCAGLVHPRLRTMLLPRELLKKRGQRIHVRIGQPISQRQLAHLLTGPDEPARISSTDANRITDYLRLRTYLLRGRIAGHPSTPTKKSTAAYPDAIINEQPQATLAGEIAALPSPRRLASVSSLAVYYASAAEIPATLREIGRLREKTFREVGEGTGRACDLDRFDEHYLHLFAWDESARQLIGAYRIGLTDQILRRRGRSGLYTSTLFRFDTRLLRQLNPALELGRSFVIPEYQRDYAPLMLLWKGIARFIVLNPRYHLLFGAVSISDEFHSVTREILMAFLQANHLDQLRAPLVRPRRPPRMRVLREVDQRRLGATIADIAGVDALVDELESHQRRLPVLLRQYLKLNAKILGFNIDPDFGDVLDGLMLADLLNVERAMLDRYLGREEALSFLAYHRSRQQPGAES